MRIERGPDGTWRIVRDDGTTLSDLEAGAVVESLVASVTASAPTPPASPPAAGVNATPGVTTDVAAITAAITASTVDVPAQPPDDWFANPAFTAETTLPSPGCSDVRGCPITITADGRVYGHMALWNTCHNGDPRGPGVCVPPPHSSPSYPEFRRGHVITASGQRVATGPLTVAANHAPVENPDGSPVLASAALDHYANTGTVVADVAAGEDEFGIWVAGTIRPGATVAQVEALRRSPLSGDWRDKDGRHELVAALAVPTPGFSVPQFGLAASAGPITRARIDNEGHVTALVAAGSQTLAQIQASPWAGELEIMRQRQDRLEGSLLPLLASAERARLDAAFDPPMVAAAGNGAAPYGNVTYADPGYQPDKKKRYPLDTASRVRSAWSYINQADNAAKYSSAQVSAIKGRIRSAAAKFKVEISA